MRATPLVFHRWARAALTLIDNGKPVSYRNLAQELGRAHQVVWRFVKRHPEVMTYINEVVTKANDDLAGLVVRRHALLGMQGSVPSAELYLKSQGGHYARGAGIGDAVPLGGGGYTLNLLIPRPDLPGLPPVTVQAVIPAAAAPAKPIPSLAMGGR